ncbi:PREDICTED: protein FAM43A, partial [Haliaeetus leucocephalus]|uniref:protein FAM43A n=1 Tax=Haliaeetus leucocephalus TaxID=52644 RepID=UPI00053CCC9C
YSALTSLARACPESALHRVGSMFRSKRRKFRVTSEDPTYTVLYLGNATTIQSKGEGCTDLAVCKIWSKSEAGRQGTKMKLTISAQGIRMAHAEDKGLRRPGHLYLLHRVTYCVADPRLPRVFAWIYRHELKHKAVMLRCHAVLVSKPEKAKAMALLLYQTSATDDLRTASALQRDQTDGLRELQKWATKECQNETQLPGCGLLPIIRQGKAAQHPGSSTLPCAKAAVT